MKIKESIERECCMSTNDFICYDGKFKEFKKKLYICRYCGDIWVYERYMDAAGSMDSRFVRLFDRKEVVDFMKKQLI